MKKGTGKSVYEIITDRVIELLEKGVIPWRKPWSEARVNGMGRAKNLSTGKVYRGVNALILDATAEVFGYKSPYWLTYKQAFERGGYVRKGENGTPIVFFKRYEAENDDGEIEIRGVYRYYTVFNLDQTEGVKLPEKIEKELDEAEPIPTLETAQAIIDGMPDPPEINFYGTKAFYSPSLDRVVVPPIAAFVKKEHFYSVLFHELAHSTGHAKRLGRFNPEDVSQHIFGSESYSKEELVAEMTAAFLNAEAGTDAVTIENSAAYIQSWIGKLKEDRRLLLSAASAAQKAADYILNVKFGSREEEAEEPVAA